jgi:hypothetical protein
LNFGTLLTSNPSLNAYNYTTTPSYLSSASDGKAIGFAPKLKVLVGSAGNVSTIANNATLQMTAVVTDSLSAFSPTVTWTANSTQGSTINASTGMFTAGDIDETGIIISATTAYGYAGTKLINVDSVTGINTPFYNSVRVFQNGSTFKVLGIEDTAYTVYSITGRHVSIGYIQDGTFRMNADKGVYLLKVNGRVAKFVIR